MIFVISIVIAFLEQAAIADDANKLKIELGELHFSRPVEQLEWLDDHRILVRQSAGGLVRIFDLHYQPPKQNSVISTEAFYRYCWPNLVSLSPSGKYIMLSCPTNNAPKQHVYLYNIDKENFENIGPHKPGEGSIALLVWGPTEDDFVYLSDNNLYYQTGPSADESKAITSDGSEDILNGVLDLFNWEEKTRAFWWSDDGEYFAYMTIDNRKVARYPIYHFTRESKRLDDGRPYPMVGAKELPVTKLIMCRKCNLCCKVLKIRAEPEQCTYLLSVSWVKFYDQFALLAVWTSRFQDVTLTTICTYDSGECMPNTITNYTSNAFPMWPCGTLSCDDTKVKFYTRNAYFTLLPQLRSNGNAYTQIAKVYVKSQGMPALVFPPESEFLPGGDYDIENIVAFDSDNSKIYYSASAPSFAQRNLYVETTSMVYKPASVAKCITCGFSPTCTFMDVGFAKYQQKQNTRANKVPKYLYLNCKGPDAPHVLLASLDYEDKLTIEFEFVSTSEFDESLPNVRYESVELENGIETVVKMILPFLSAPTKKYPVLVDVYGGPGFQSVRETFNDGIVKFFASHEGYVVVFIDGRGSGGRGWKNRGPLHGHLGTVEVDDQIETVRELLKRHDFLDANRVGIWGWSYGGFVSAQVVRRDRQRIFKCIASVAPVTDFRLYDAIYTERYMGRANDAAYEQTDLTRDVESFKNVPFLLAHGTADDNVHVIHSLRLIWAMIEAGVEFDLTVYTDESFNLRPDIRQLIDEHFQRHFSNKDANSRTFPTLSKVLLYVDESHGMNLGRRHLISQIAEHFRSCFSS